MTGPARPSSDYLDSTGYRRRRLQDAAKLLPLLGLLLWLVPLLWLVQSENSTENAGAVMYIFGVWVVLILLAALNSHLLRRAEQAKDDEGAD